MNRAKLVPSLAARENSGPQTRSCNLTGMALCRRIRPRIHSRHADCGRTAARTAHRRPDLPASTGLGRINSGSGKPSALRFPLCVFCHRLHGKAIEIGFEVAVRGKFYGPGAPEGLGAGVPSLHRILLRTNRVIGSLRPNGMIVSLSASVPSSREGASATAATEIAEKTGFRTIRECPAVAGGRLAGMLAFAAEAPCCNSVDTPHERTEGRKIS